MLKTRRLLLLPLVLRWTIWTFLVVWYYNACNIASAFSIGIASNFKWCPRKETRIRMPWLYSLQKETCHDDNKSKVVAPVPHRDEDRYLFIAGSDGGDNASTAMVGEEEFNNNNQQNTSKSLPDPYGWMRDDTRTSKMVLDYIRQEQEYARACNSENVPLQQALAKEFQRYTPQHDIGQIYSAGGYYYFIMRRSSNGPFPLHCRYPQQQSTNNEFQLDLTDTNHLEILLDENKQYNHFKKNNNNNKNSTSSSYWNVHSVVPSPSHRLVAYSVDTVGNESYDIYVCNITQQQQHPSNDNPIHHVASGTSGTIVWGLTDDTLYFVGMDTNVFQPVQWFRWQKSINGDNDTTTTTTTLLDEEIKPNVFCDLTKTMDGQYVLWSCFESSSKMTTISALHLHTNRLNMLSFHHPILSLQHRKGVWWALWEDDDKDGAKLYTANVDDASRNEWTLVDCRGLDTCDQSTKVDSSITSFFLFQNHVSFQGRQGGLSRVWIAPILEDNTAILSLKQVELKESESAHYVTVGRIQDYFSNTAILSFESMISPPQILGVDLEYNDTIPNSPPRDIILQTTQIPGYQKEEYGCDRLYVLSRDGKTQIPVSIVYRKDVSRPGRLHLLGYGAYGHCLEPAFSSMKIPLLNRGIVCAIAHVRGGGEFGRAWYEDGKGADKKIHSIHDFVDVANALVDQGWTTPQYFSCEGRSAGGLLVSAAVNQAPSLFRAVFLGVPFLDVLASMSDPSLPLTSFEYNEWGNPHIIDRDYALMKSYCPVQNIKENVVYPSFWIAASLHDPRTPYWESLKFAATLRYKTAKINNKNRSICVNIDTDAGHSLGSNRTKYYEEMGSIYAYIIDQLNKN